jgi:hypothetical protein
LAGETEIHGENLPSAALSITNPTCCPDANPDRRGEKPTTNRLNYGTGMLYNTFLLSEEHYVVGLFSLICIVGGVE